MIISFLIAGDRFYSPQPYSADLSQAEWITTHRASATGYFRKKFALPYMPDRAYLIVTATESAEVFINGKRVGQMVLVEHQPTMILDVGLNLRTGENVLAIQVDTLSANIAPTIRARLSRAIQAGLRPDFRLRHLAVQSHGILLHTGTRNGRRPFLLILHLFR